MKNLVLASAVGVVMLAAGRVGAAQAAEEVKLQALAGSMQAIELRIDTECSGGDAYFKVTNVGAAWPKSGSFSIYRMTGGTMISQRRMRMGEDQTASFRVRGAARSGQELGLFIEPGWYARSRVYDATVKCE